jgi:mono/diheme cytochrome c family protein
MRTVHTILAVLTLAVVAAVAAAQGDWKAPPEAKALRNPVTGPGDARQVVDANCTSCHGDGGRGDGPAAPALPSKPADWTHQPQPARVVQ